ncbi:MAG: hypothetical protein NTU79_07785 [Planctomycetota bacterium]|nr:hypothetical protein [Planctomycetota bacterium]
MTPTASEIETIVRRVLSTLTAIGAQSHGEKSVLFNRLSLTDQVISLQSLKNRLAGIQVLEVGRAAVLTPAAKDYCRELRVELVRVELVRSAIGEKSSMNSSPIALARPQRLVVAGSTNYMTSISKQLCSKQAAVIDKSADDATAMRTIAEKLRTGHQAGVAIVESPHAACWQAARDDRLRPAVIAQWSDLDDVLREVPVNVLVLSSKSWNIPSACNVARRFFQHLQNHS